MVGLIRSPGQVAKHQSAAFALKLGERPDVAKPAYADGGTVTGALLGTDGGRTDTLPIKVPPGSFVVPADVVSGLPSAQGNSLAGHNALNKLFASLPLSPDEAPYGAAPPNLPRGQTMPGLHREQRHLLQGVAPSKRGGVAKGPHEGVDILAAAGEHVIKPEDVKRLGRGSLERGHKILDQFVDWVRSENIKTLKKLPGTVKS